MSDAENTPQEEAKKEEQTHIQLKIAGAGFPDLMIRVKPTTKLSKMMAAYCDRAGKAQNEVRFMFDGVKLNGNQTVSDLDLEGDEDEVTIDVTQEAIGGSF